MTGGPVFQISKTKCNSLGGDRNGPMTGSQTFKIKPISLGESNSKKTPENRRQTK
jgi:hypothetical protein